MIRKSCEPGRLPLPRGDRERDIVEEHTGEWLPNRKCDTGRTLQGA